MDSEIKIDYTDDDIKQIIRYRIYNDRPIGTNLEESKRKKEILCNRVKTLSPIIETLVRHGQMFHDVHMLSPDFIRTNDRNGHLKFIISKNNVIDFGIKLTGDEVFDMPEEALFDIEQQTLIENGCSFQLLKDRGIKNIEIEYTPCFKGLFDNLMSMKYNTEYTTCVVPDVFLDWIIFDIRSFTENFYQWVKTMNKGEI